MEEDRELLDRNKALLDECHYDVRTATSRADALRVLRASSVDDFDVALISGKGADTSQGQKVMDAARAKQIPVVLIGEPDDDTFVVKGIKLGAAQVLTRPLQTFQVAKLWHHAVRAMVKRRTQAVPGVLPHGRAGAPAPAASLAASCGGARASGRPAGPAGKDAEPSSSSQQRAPKARGGVSKSGKAGKAAKPASRSRSKAKGAAAKGDAARRNEVAAAAIPAPDFSFFPSVGNAELSAQVDMSSDELWSMGGAVGIFGDDDVDGADGGKNSGDESPHASAGAGGVDSSDASIMSKGNGRGNGSGGSSRSRGGQRAESSRSRANGGNGNARDSAGAPAQDPWGCAILPQVAARCQALAAERTTGGPAPASAAAASPRGALTRGLSMDMLAPPPQPLPSIGLAEEVAKKPSLGLRLKKSASLLSLISEGMTVEH